MGKVNIDVQGDLHLYCDPDDDTSQKIDRILELLSVLRQGEKLIMRELDDLTTQVQQTDDVQQSALVLINGISDRLAAAGTDPTKLAELSASLKSNSDALSAAVAANTPVETAGRGRSDRNDPSAPSSRSGGVQRT